MTRNILTAAAVIALAAVLSTSALAQYESSDRSRIGIALAAARPSGTELKALNSTWLGAVAQFNLTFDEYDRPSTLLSLGWFGQSGSSGNANYVPLGATYIKRFGKEESCWYVGGGPTLYFANYKNQIATGPFSAVLDSGNGARLGYSFIAGREFNGWFAEIKRDGVAKLSTSMGSSIDFSNWSYAFGTRIAF